MQKLLPIVFLSTLGFSAHAQIHSGPWPCKTVRYVVPFATAGATDLLGRMLQPKLQEALQTTIVIDNKPGAGGNVGSDIVAKAAGDGCTIGGGTVSSHAINVSLYGAKMPYDPLKDFAHIAMLATLPNVLAINPKVPANNLAEFIAYAKANPGKLNFASAGNGTSQHLSGELFKSMAGVDMQHVPYKGSGPGLTATLAGEVQLFFDNALTVIPHIQSGKLKALGVTSDKPSASLPNVPTIAQAGNLPGYALVSWQAVFAPASLPAPLAARLHVEVMKILALPETREKLAQLGSDAGTMTQEQLSTFIKTEITKFADVVKKSGAKID